MSDGPARPRAHDPARPGAPAPRQPLHRHDDPVARRGAIAHGRPAPERRAERRWRAAATISASPGPDAARAGSWSIAHRERDERAERISRRGCGGVREVERPRRHADCAGRAARARRGGSAARTRRHTRHALGNGSASRSGPSSVGARGVTAPYSAAATLSACPRSRPRRERACAVDGCRGAFAATRRRRSRALGQAAAGGDHEPWVTLRRLARAGGLGCHARRDHEEVAAGRDAVAAPSTENRPRARRVGSNSARSGRRRQESNGPGSRWWPELTRVAQASAPRTARRGARRDLDEIAASARALGISSVAGEHADDAPQAVRPARLRAAAGRDRRGATVAEDARGARGTRRPEDLGVGRFDRPARLVACRERALPRGRVADADGAGDRFGLATSLHVGRRPPPGTRACAVAAAPGPWRPSPWPRGSPSSRR